MKHQIRALLHHPECLGTLSPEWKIKENVVDLIKEALVLSKEQNEKPTKFKQSLNDMATNFT